jgi:hypothetical protein
MTGLEIVLLVIGIAALVVLLIRYNTGDPFDYCGRRRVYVAEF